MKKRLLSLILAFCLTLSALMGTTSAASSDTLKQCGVNATWTLDSDKTLIISGTGPMYNYDVITNFSPWHMGSARAVKIEEGITTVGSNAFGWMFSLKSVYIPRSVVHIYNDAFINSRMITDIYYEGTESDWNKIVIGSGNYTLNNATIHYESKGNGNSGTCGAGLNWVLSDNGVLTISGTGEMDDFAGGGDGTAPWYPNRKKINAVIIEEGVTSTGYCAFWECTNITSITLPNTLTKIGGFSFALCTSLKVIDIPDNVTQIGFSAFGACYSLTNVTIPKGVTKIEGQTFAECTGLRTIMIPIGITEIGDVAFWKCPDLTDVYYGGSKSDWNAIVIGNDNDELLNATLHYAVPSQNMGDIQSKTVKFNDNIDVDLNWGWSLFNRDASQYSHDLAMAALVLSNATELSESEAIARMAALGFEYIEPIDYYNISFAKDRPAAVFGSKKVTFADGAEKVIVAVNIRGTNQPGDYLTDGASQFNGFLSAGRIKKKQLCEYITKVGKVYGCAMNEDNTILFISGHSLGGATAGLLAELMRGSAKQKNMFIYTFASPNYDTQGNDITSYTNVHNIINMRDVFPNVPIGYKRYGHDWHYDANDYREEAKRVYGDAWDDKHKDWLYNHFLETYLACMLSDVPSNMGGGVMNPYALSSIHCSANIEVLDNNGNVIGWTDGETIHNPDMNNVLIMTDGDAKYVWTPTDKQYTIRFTATDDGMMTFKQQTFDLSGNITDEKAFQNVRLTNQKTITADIGGEIAPFQTRLFVVGTDDVTKTAEIQEDGTEFSLLKGDINKDSRIDLTDAQFALKAALQIIWLDEESQYAADVDNSGKVDLQDAGLILKRALGIIQDF